MAVFVEIRELFDSKTEQCWNIISAGRYDSAKEALLELESLLIKLAESAKYSSPIRVSLVEFGNKCGEKE